MAELNEELDARLAEVRARIQAASPDPQLQSSQDQIVIQGVEQLVILNFNIERLIAAADAAAVRAAQPTAERAR